jgi:hypothetical protein
VNILLLAYCGMVVFRFFRSDSSEVGRCTWRALGRQARSRGVYLSATSKLDSAAPGGDVDAIST